MTIPKLALTFEEAAEACGYSLRTLKYQVAAGSLVARYANSEGVIRVEDLAQWLDALPVEPMAGRRSVSTFDEGEKGVHTVDAPGRTEGVISNDTPHDDFRSAELVIKPRYRKPEDVASELGMKPTELRRYCRESGIHTRLSQNRIMLCQEDVERLLEWVTERQTKKTAHWTVDEEGEDPFG